MPSKLGSLRAPEGGAKAEVPSRYLVDSNKASYTKEVKKGGTTQPPLGEVTLTSRKRALIIDTDSSDNDDMTVISPKASVPTVATPTASSISYVAKPLPTKKPKPWDAMEFEMSRPVHGKQGARLVQSVLDPSRKSAGPEDPKKVKFLLSGEQQRILQAVVEEEKSIFFTGSAGTGKSVLLREIISTLKDKYRNSENAVAVTASTGIAACNIGGTTVHWFAGIGTGEEPTDVIIAKLFKNPQARTRWRKARVLIIDEVSMLDGVLFDKLNDIAIAMRKNVAKQKPELKGRPFGGIQLIITGDFFQLPPVNKSSNIIFAFESKAWKLALEATYNLTQVFRQKDADFVNILNEMRFGKLSPQSIQRFKALSRPITTGNIEPTELFPMRYEVDRSNTAKLNAIRKDPVKFVAEDWAENPSHKKMLSNFLATDQLILKEGAQVMLIKNLEGGLVNGTIGRVISFGPPPDYIVRDDYAKKRTKLGFNDNYFRDPYVEWITPNGVERRLVCPEEFRIEDHTGKKIAHRRQFPLILAWAMSIHKSQGQTIPYVKVDLGRVFERGQSYVALSRAQSLEGLQVLRFDPSRVTVHPKVAEWHRTLTSV